MLLISITFSTASSSSALVSVMGLALSIVGIQREEEPAYTVVLDRNEVYRKQAGVVPYEIRRYGTRYAIEAAFDDPSAPPPSAGSRPRSRR